MPAFYGYYITHDWTPSGEATMSFAPHQDSEKTKIRTDQTPGNVLEVRLMSENVDNSEESALWIALVLTLLAITIWVIYVILGIYKGDSNNSTTTLIAIVAGLVVAVLFFFLVRYFFSQLLAPGEKKQKVRKAEESPPFVRAGHATLLGLLSLAMYKLFGKKSEPQA